MNPLLRRRALVAVPAALFLACTLGPTGQDVVDESAPVICEKAKECSPTFDIVYPGGVPECAQKVKSELTKRYGDQLERQSVCTQEQLDSCLKGLRAAACPGNGELPKPPCDC